MERGEAFNKFKQLLVRLLKVSQSSDLKGCPEITMETDIVDDLGIDSVEIVDLMTMVEKEFNVDVDLAEAGSNRTVSQIVDYIIELEKKS